MTASKENKTTPICSKEKQCSITELLFTKSLIKTWSTFLSNYINPPPKQLCYQHSPSWATEVNAVTPSNFKLEPEPASATTEKTSRNGNELFKKEEEVSTHNYVNTNNKIQTFTNKQNK